MSFDLASLTSAIDLHGAVARIVVARTAGSVPRDAGVAMLVWDGGQYGTIGGGTLEWEAARLTREMLSSGAERRMMVMPLGPALGQCCGGSVTLVAERFTAQTIPARFPFVRPLNPEHSPKPLSPAQIEARARAGLAVVDGWLIEDQGAPTRPIWIYGAGHIGRALVNVLAPLPDVALTWVDFADDRFPGAITPSVTKLVATDPSRLVRFAPVDADHLILTHSHELDFALCHAVLGHHFASAGLIGSATKWARFRSRLAALGHTSEQIARIACPIGEPAFGKHPQAIALGVAAAMLRPVRTAFQNMNHTEDKAG